MQVAGMTPRTVAAILLTSSVLAAVSLAGSGGRSTAQLPPVAPTSAPLPSPPALAVIADAPSSPVRPAEGFDLSGRATVTALAHGDVLLRVEVTGSVEELGEAIPLWHIIEGTCARWREASAVRYRFNPPVDAPGRQSFSFVIAQQHVTSPLLLAAFRQGGGPLLACADLPLSPSSRVGIPPR